MDDRLFSIAVGLNPSLLGEHTLEVEIQTDNVPYPISIIDHTVNVPVSVRCTDPELMID